MPVFPIPGQVGPDGLTQPYANQCTFGQIVGRVNGYAKHCSASVVQNLINNVVRRIYDRRNWYGNLVKGQILAPGFYSTGSVSMVAGSPIVQGTGTAWTTAMVGQQFRYSFTAPIYTIVAVDPVAQRLTLELPWGLQSVSTTGYWITQYYYKFQNVKAFLSIKNLALMFRLMTNVPQSLLENWDPARLQLFYSRVAATMPSAPDGSYQIELWPAPSTVQAFPYLAWIQQPNLVDDSDNLPAFIRSDVIELGAVSEILLYQPKANPGYSENLALQMSQRFKTEFERELRSAEEADEFLYRQDVVRQEEALPTVSLDWGTGAYIGGGDFLRAMSPIPVGYGEDW